MVCTIYIQINLIEKFVNRYYTFLFNNKVTININSREIDVDNKYVVLSISDFPRLGSEIKKKDVVCSFKNYIHFILSCHENAIVLVLPENAC